jgi:hypothetical protein
VQILCEFGGLCPVERGKLFDEFPKLLGPPIGRREIHQTVRERMGARRYPGNERNVRILDSIGRGFLGRGRTDSSAKCRDNYDGERRPSLCIYLIGSMHARLPTTSKTITACTICVLQGNCKRKQRLERDSRFSCLRKFVVSPRRMRSRTKALGSVLTRRGQSRLRTSAALAVGSFRRWWWWRWAILEHQWFPGRWLRRSALRRPIKENRADFIELSRCWRPSDYSSLKYWLPL